jgi:hypothetical protein
VIGAGPVRSVLIWTALAAALAVPVVVAAASPLLAWRDPIYIAAGFAGVVGLALLLIQPLLAGGYLPGLRMRLGRRLHRWVGAGLVTAVMVMAAKVVVDLRMLAGIRRMASRNGGRAVHTAVLDCSCKGDEA